MKQTEEKIDHYIHDHHLSYGLLFIGFIFLIWAGIYISQFAFGIKNPEFFAATTLSSSLTSLLSLIVVYGYPVLIMILLIGYIGLPIPATGILLALGAVATTGQVNLIGLITIISLTNIVGNMMGYVIGRKFTFLVHNKKAYKLGFTPKRIKSVDEFLQSWGAWCIFLTHCVLTPIEVPVNVVAGMGKYPIKRFLLLILVSEVLWTSFYLSLGFFLGSNWVVFLTYITDVPKILTTVIIGVFAVYIALKIRRKIHLNITI
ncbi:MAG: DedA family protein [Candidatus Levybacteria bacterium]|nr:DedA family protein [Candidatus Levybacteria bacterium]